MLEARRREIVKRREERLRRGVLQRRHEQPARRPVTRLRRDQCGSELQMPDQLDCVQRSCAAEADEGTISWIDAAFNRHTPYATGEIRGGDVVHSAPQLTGAKTRLSR